MIETKTTTASMASWIVITSAAVLFTVGCATPADLRTMSEHPVAATEPTPADPLATATRIYDVSDLLIDIPDFTNAPQFNAAPTTQFLPPARTREQCIRDLLTTITSTIDPLSWQSNTGRVGTIRELNGQLIITQTAGNHALIDSKLQAMRAPRAVQLMIETIMITSPAAEAQLDRSGKAWLEPDGIDAQLWPSFLSQVEADGLVRLVRMDKQSSIVTAPRMTIFNNQRAYVLVSRQTAYVADFKPKGGDFEPQTRLAESGMVIDAQARVSDDRKLITLTVRPQFASLLDLVAAPWPQAPPGKPLQVMIPHLRTTKADLTVTLPAGQWALYRLTPQDTPAQPHRWNDFVNALLLVRPLVIAVEPHAPNPLRSTKQTTVTQASPVGAPALP